MKNTTLILIVLLSFFSSKAQEIKNSSLEYIKEYYSNFSTGYNFDGKYITVTDNYKTKLSGSLFTLTFDTFDTNHNKQNKTVSFNLKKIISIEPFGGDNIEIIGDETLIIPLNGEIAFKTKTEEYNINIYYEVDDDVEKTEIYKAFEELIKPL